MMTSDINFDDKAHWFQRRIYGGMNVALRLDALWWDMLMQIPAISWRLRIYYVNRTLFGGRDAIYILSL
jgi:hypothetical protein